MVVTTTLKKMNADISKKLTGEQIEEIRQEHETFLTALESLAVQALATRDWAAVYSHISHLSTNKINLCDHFRSEQDFVEAFAFINQLLGEASAKDLHRPGAGPFSQRPN